MRRKIVLFAAVVVAVPFGWTAIAHAAPPCADKPAVAEQAAELALTDIEGAVLSAKNDYDPDDKSYDLDYNDDVLSEVSSADPDQLLAFVQKQMANPNAAVREAALDVASRLGEPGAQILLTASETTGARDLLVRQHLSDVAMSTSKDGKPYLATADAMQILKNVYSSLSPDQRFYVVSNVASTFGKDPRKGLDTLDFYVNVAMKDSQVNQKKAALTAADAFGPAALPLFKMGMADQEPNAGDTCDVHSFAVDLAPSVLGSATLSTLTGQYDTMHGCDQVRASTLGAASDMITGEIKAGQAPSQDQIQQTQQLLLQGVSDHSPDDSSVVRLSAVESAEKLAKSPRVGWKLMTPVLVAALQDSVNQDPRTPDGRQILLEAAHAADYAGIAGTAVCQAAMDSREPQEVQAIGHDGCVSDQ